MSMNTSQGDLTSVLAKAKTLIVNGLQFEVYMHLSTSYSQQCACFLRYGKIHLYNFTTTWQKNLYTLMFEPLLANDWTRQGASMYPVKWMSLDAMGKLIMKMCSL